MYVLIKLRQFLSSVSWGKSVLTFGCSLHESALPSPGLIYVGTRLSWLLWRIKIKKAQIKSQKCYKTFFIYTNLNSLFQYKCVCSKQKLRSAVNSSRNPPKPFLWAHLSSLETPDLKTVTSAQGPIPPKSGAAGQNQADSSNSAQRYPAL